MFDSLDYAPLGSSLMSGSYSLLSPNYNSGVHESLQMNFGPIAPLPPLQSSGSDWFRAGSAAAMGLHIATANPAPWLAAAGVLGIAGALEGQIPLMAADTWTLMTHNGNSGYTPGGGWSDAIYAGMQGYANNPGGDDWYVSDFGASYVTPSYSYGDGFYYDTGPAPGFSPVTPLFDGGYGFDAYGYDAYQWTDFGGGNNG